MSPGVHAILQAALALPPENRVILAERILESLEGDERAEIDAAWAGEVEDRLRAYDGGTLKAIPGDEVLRSSA
jgi:putative addiction module component (TIGR02574 family)